MRPILRMRCLKKLQRKKKINRDSNRGLQDAVPCCFRFCIGQPTIVQVLMTIPKPKPDPIFLFTVVVQPVSNIITHKHTMSIFFIRIDLLLFSQL